MISRLLSIGFLLVLGGCGLLGSEDTTISATGRAVTATGEPIPGLSVALSRSLRFGSVPAAETRTDSNGAFSISYDPGDIASQLDLGVNNTEPYDPRYSSFRDGISPGDRLDLGDINLSLSSAP